MRKPLRIAVTGGRDFAFRNAVFAALDRVHRERGVSCIIHGGATGADAWASAWAEFNGVMAVMFPADWQTHGRSAGPIRNQQMLDHGNPDALVAFPGGDGTADMVRRATGRIPIWHPVQP